MGEVMGSAAGLDQVIQSILPFLSGWALMSARAIGLAMYFPVFSFLNLPMSVRFAFAGAIGLPLMVGGESAIAAAMNTGPVQIGMLAVKEVAIGMFLGFLAGLPFSAAQNAGAIIDSYRGSTAGTLFDPSLTTESSEFGVTLFVFAVGLMVWAGGLPLIVAALYGSYAIWPPLSFIPDLDPASAVAVGGTIHTNLASALSISATMLICLFTLEMALGLASRSARQFQVFELSLTIKNLAFVFLLPILALPMLHLIDTELASLKSVLDFLRALNER